MIEIDREHLEGVICKLNLSSWRSHCPLRRGRCTWLSPACPSPSHSGISDTSRSRCEWCAGSGRDRLTWGQFSGGEESSEDLPRRAAMTVAREHISLFSQSFLVKSPYRLQPSVALCRYQPRREWPTDWGLLQLWRKTPLSLPRPLHITEIKVLFRSTTELRRMSL